MKILALDIGDRWVGVAVSDSLAMFSRPLQTVTFTELPAYLETVLLPDRIRPSESIGTIVAGLPKTMRGTQSDQTKKIIETVEQLKQQFNLVEWVLWDERMTSQQAARIKPSKNKQDKVQSHSLAAALILQSYLDHLAFKRTLNNLE